MLTIGIDLDNTLADYRAPLEELCAGYGLRGPHADPKLTLRQELRSKGNESEWTRLQGELYGPLMQHAELFVGAAEAVHRLLKSGAQIVIVSHRTRHPLSGANYDLHASARHWLEAKMPGSFPVFFEESKDAKVGRIAALGCGIFVDDLPEILRHDKFPAAVRKILFDPGNSHPPQIGLERAATWADVAELVTV